MIKNFFLTVAGLFLLFSTVTAGEIEKFFDNLQSIRSLEGSFSQKNYYSELEESYEFRGSFILKRPDKLAWRYEKGSKDSVYVSGTKAILIQPEEKQAIIQDIKDLGITRAPILFIFNKEMMKKEFTVLSETAEQIVLKPKQDSTGLKSVVILLKSSKDFPVRGFRFEDLYGNIIEIRLQSLKINPGLKDEDFNFSIPEGYAVLNASSP